jgi:ABC-type microcin C transport system permease subunit YejE
MKIRMSKIRNKRLKGNISLLVILILLASSVIALLSINQIQRLISYGNMTFNYFRAFYLAKAGTELGLTEVYNRDN